MEALRQAIEAVAFWLYVVAMAVGLSTLGIGLVFTVILKWERKRRQMGIGVWPRKWMLRK